MPTSQTGEWRAHWPITIAAMVGYSAIGLQSYGISPFVPHLENAFGWSRADVMLGLSLSNLAGVFLNILVGFIVDRIGARRVGLFGLVLKTGAFALLATATGSLLNWSLLWLLIAVGVVCVQSTVWTSAVAARFDRSRGMAMAIVLSGAPVTAMIAPLLATGLIARFGWQGGLVGVGAAWLSVSFPVVFLLYDRRRKGDGAEAAPQANIHRPGLTLREGIRTRAFFCLILSFGAFSFYNMSIATNMVPLLTETGISPLTAAEIASLMGVAGIVSRLAVGFLLDRFSGRAIGAITQILPVLACGILLADLPGVLPLAVAATLFGIATGAEIDVALYLATRHFGLKSFATLFGAIITFGAINAAIGPFLAGTLHDASGNYDLLLMLIMVAMTVGAAAVGLIGRPPEQYAGSR